MAETFARWLDWPPLWTLAGVLVIRVLALILGWIGLPLGFGVFGPGLALACLVLGLWLMGSAALAMGLARTTVNPRGMPSALMTGGVFAISRNPIYLGDLFVLLAAVFWWDVPLGLLVVAGFVPLITERFIRTEEERLAGAFGDDAAAWFNRTRRWL